MYDKIDRVRSDVYLPDVPDVIFAAESKTYQFMKTAIEYDV